MSKTKPIKEKKEKQEKTTKPVRLPRSVQQLIPVKRVFPDSIWQVGNNEFSQTWSFSDINYAVASLDDQRTILDSWGRVLNGLAADSRMIIFLIAKLDRGIKSLCINFTDRITNFNGPVRTMPVYQ